jgi:hypothetical protein
MQTISNVLSNLGNLLLLIIFLSGWISSLQFFCRLKFNFAAPIFATTQILLGYIAYIFGYLKEFYLFTYYIGIVLFVLVLLITYRLKRIQEIFSYEWWLFLGVLFLGYMRFAGAYYYAWDEFSFWGNSVKELYLFDGKSTDMISGFSSYPRGVQFFVYTILKIIGHSEGYSLFGNFTLILLFAVSILGTRNIWKDICLLMSVLFIVSYAYPGLRAIYVDHTVALIFGSVVSLYLQSNNKYKALIIIAPMLFMLPIIKQIGFILAYFAILFVVVDLRLSWNNIINKKSVIFLVLLLIPLPYLAETSWLWFIKSDTSVIQTILLKLAKLQYNLQNPAYTKVVFVFLYKIFTNGLLGNANALLLVTIFVSYKVISKYLPVNKYKHILITLAAMFVLYSIHRLFLYLTVFTLEESLRTASIERYIGTYIASAAIVLLAPVRLVFINHPSLFLLNNQRVLKLLSIFIFAAISFKLIHKPPLTLSVQRQKIKENVNAIKYLQKEMGSRVFIVFDNVDRFDCNLYSHEFMFNDKPQNMGQCGLFANSAVETKKPYRLNDKFLQHFNIDEFKPVTKTNETHYKYDLLFVPKGSECMWSTLLKVIQIDPKYRKNTTFIRQKFNIFVPFKLKS